VLQAKMQARISPQQAEAEETPDELSDE
jgi:hypothetical protein